MKIPQPKYQVGFREYRRVHLYKVGGNEYPSVTKIIGIVDKSGPLIIWARREALKLAKTEILAAINAGITLDEAHLESVLAKADKQPDKIKDDAADLGTRVHSAIDAYIMGKEPILDADTEAGYKNFRAWLNTSGIKIVQGDTAVASVVNGYGGKLDAIGEKDGKLIILDWKTSNSFKGRDTYSMQASAYSAAFCEMYGVEVSKAYVVRLGKTIPGDVEVKQVNLAPAWLAFKAALDLTKSMKSHLWIEAVDVEAEDIP
jgi:hypothetical protein